MWFNKKKNLGDSANENQLIILWGSIYLSTEITCSGLQLYLETVSNTGVFLWILRNFKAYLFYRTSESCCFCMCINIKINI